jgi:SAM-dependent methyltransferase
MEPHYPLHVKVCGRCFLVQLPDTCSSEHIFSDYAYFSSFSDSWLLHARTYAEKMVSEFGIDRHSQVVEIASNDGYLLKNFVEKGIPVLGVEPAKNVAQAAIQLGVPTVTQFFGLQTAQELVEKGYLADLLIGNNVLAHVPDLNDFIDGLKVVLKPSGVLSMEFPHLLRLVEENQFDTIYHEHFSYFSFLTVSNIFAGHGLKLFDVEELSTHGGSLRIYGCHLEDRTRQISDRARRLIASEEEKGFKRIEFYRAFQEKVVRTKFDILSFLINVKTDGKTVCAYGAPAKGNTLLNFCGIGTDFIDYTVDRNPHKQNHFLPGSQIPIHSPERIRQTRPDYLLILPWNLKDEIMEQMAFIREWGGRFVTLIPSPMVFS